VPANPAIQLSGGAGGDLSHALERVLPTSVLVARYKLADSALAWRFRRG
jgi:hypothetical protein